MARGKTGLTQDERKRADRDRKRKVRKNLRAQGLKPYEVWVTATEWPQVKRYIQCLAQKRSKSGQ